MNPAQIENVIAKAISGRLVSPNDRYNLICDGTLIMCIPVKDMKETYHRIDGYTEDALKKGFTAKEWSVLVEKTQRWLRFRL